MSAQKTIEYILNDLNVTSAKFADSLEINPSNISKILSGHTIKISRSLSRKINTVYPQYDYDRLVNSHKDNSFNEKNEVISIKKTASNKIKVGQNEVDIDDFVESLVVNEEVLRNHPTMKLWITKIEQEGAIRILTTDRTKA